MTVINRKTVWIIAVLCIGGLTGGCEAPGVGSKLLDSRPDLGATIGSLGVIYSPESVAIEGYGLVGGLQGTGSSECPPELRAYLKRYILTQLPEHKIDVDKLIDSLNTAVVHVGGEMPSLASKTQRFDVMVGALGGTQTTSLEGGWLYGAELRAAGRMGASTRPVASAGGPIFTDQIDGLGMSRRMGYVLGGGRVFEEYKLNLVLNKPDFETTSGIRNRINERFGYGTARAVLPGRIELTVPPKYAKQRQRFVSVVEATYLTEDPQINKERILAFVKELAVAQDKYKSEIALEAIGNEGLGKLSVLLNSSDERVRLHAARCMFNLGSDEGLSALIEIALNKGSALRVEALETLTTSAQRSDAAAISRRLLGDDSFDIRLAAYEQLVQLEDLSVTRELVGRSFYLDQVVQSQHKGVFVSRTGEARIVLFGAPIMCRDNIFVQSEDGTVVLNAPSGQRYVSVIRRQTGRGGAIGQLKSSLDLADIIRVLCEEPATKDKQGRGGLGVSYSQMTALLKQMSDKGAIRAEFRAGPLPKIGVNLKK
jgi:hypothetical protein